MKSLLYLVIFTYITFSSFSHDYYFSFSEMEYNVKSRKFELTLIVSTHDIEHWLQHKGLDVKELEDIQTDTVMQNKIGSCDDCIWIFSITVSLVFYFDSLYRT